MTCVPIFHLLITSSFQLNTVFLYHHPPLSIQLSHKNHNVLGTKYLRFLYCGKSEAAFDILKDDLPDNRFVFICCGQSERIKADVEKLVNAIQSCTEAAQALKNGKITKREVLDSLNMAWVAAEKCNVWSENMQVILLHCVCIQVGCILGNSAIMDLLTTAV